MFNFFEVVANASRSPENGYINEELMKIQEENVRLIEEWEDLRRQVDILSSKAEKIWWYQESIEKLWKQLSIASAMNKELKEMNDELMEFKKQNTFVIENYPLSIEQLKNVVDWRSISLFKKVIESIMFEALNEWMRQDMTTNDLAYRRWIIDWFRSILTEFLKIDAEIRRTSYKDTPENII